MVVGLPCYKRDSPVRVNLRWRMIDKFCRKKKRICTVTNRTPIASHRLCANSHYDRRRPSLCWISFSGRRSPDLYIHDLMLSVRSRLRFIFLNFSDLAPCANIKVLCCNFFSATLRYNHRVSIPTMRPCLPHELPVHKSTSCLIL